MPTSNIKKASPKDLIWAGSVQWESGNGSPTYAYVFGLDESAVDTALQHVQNATTKKEFQENYSAWVLWLGRQSKKTGQKEIFEGIEESLKIQGPSRHQLDEMWFDGAHMPEVLQRIETEPLVIDLPTMAFDDLAPYCQNPGALKPFVIGVQNADLEPAYTMAYTKENEMTQRKQTPPRRRTMRRKATAKQIRQEVRQRLERRAAGRADKQPVARRRPAVTPRPERRVSAERVNDMGKDRSRKERLAELQDRREGREHEVRMAELQERREERERDLRLAELRDSREERMPPQRRRAAPKRRRAPVAANAAAPKKAEVAAPSQNKQIYVKAGNSAGMPEGYYELDAKATRKYQAHLKRTAAAPKKASAAPKKVKKTSSKKRRKAAPKKRSK